MHHFLNQINAKSTPVMTGWLICSPLTASLHCLQLLWLAGVISLVLVLWHSHENHSKYIFLNRLQQLRWRSHATPSFNHALSQSYELIKHPKGMAKFVKEVVNFDWFFYFWKTEQPYWTHSLWFTADYIHCGAGLFKTQWQAWFSNLP